MQVCKSVRDTAHVVHRAYVHLTCSARMQSKQVCAVNLQDAHENLYDAYAAQGDE